MSPSREADAPPPARMTRAEFRAWAEGRRGRFERIDRMVIEMAAERVGHVRAKTAAQAVLARAIRAAGVGCEALGDGVTIEIGEDGDFQPDALIHCGPRLRDDETVAPNPVVVVEVSSPSTARRDETAKLVGYARVPSIRHYLLVDPRLRLLVHFRRHATGFDTFILSAGPLRLDPLGIAVDIADFFADLDEAPPE